MTDVPETNAVQPLPVQRWCLPNAVGEETKFKLTTLKAFGLEQVTFPRL